MTKIQKYNLNGKDENNDVLFHNVKLKIQSIKIHTLMYYTCEKTDRIKSVV